MAQRLAANARVVPILLASVLVVLGLTLSGWVPTFTSSAPTRSTPPWTSGPGVQSAPAWQAMVLGAQATLRQHHEPAANPSEVRSSGPRDEGRSSGQQQDIAP